MPKSSESSGKAIFNRLKIASISYHRAGIRIKKQFVLSAAIEAESFERIILRPEANDQSSSKIRFDEPTRRLSARPPIVYTADCPMCLKNLINEEIVLKISESE
jgi:hypothetical protein